MKAVVALAALVLLAVPVAPLVDEAGPSRVYVDGPDAPPVTLPGVNGMTLWATPVPAEPAPDPAEATACDLHVLARVVTPMASATVGVPDIEVKLHDQLAPVADPENNRWVPSSYVVAEEVTDADGRVAFCVARAALTDGDLDAFLSVETMSGATSVAVPLGTSVNARQDLGSSWRYVATSTTRPDVPDGTTDLGAWRPSGPGAYPAWSYRGDCSGFAFTVSAIDRVEQVLCQLEIGDSDPGADPTDVVTQADAARAFVAFAGLMHASRWSEVDGAVGDVPFVWAFYPSNLACSPACYFPGRDEIHFGTEYYGYATSIHEFGHHLQYRMANGDSEGGFHTCSGAWGERPAVLAWREGFGDFLPSVATRGRMGHMCGGEGGGHIDPVGALNEANVAHALHDLLDAANDGETVVEPWSEFWAAFVGPNTFCDFEARWEQLHAGQPDAGSVQTVAVLNGIRCDALPGL